MLENFFNLFQGSLLTISLFQQVNMERGIYLQQHKFVPSAGKTTEPFFLNSVDTHCADDVHIQSLKEMHVVQFAEWTLEFTICALCFKLIVTLLC